MIHLHAYVRLQHRRRVQKFVAGTRQARIVQQQTLTKKLRRHAESEFGRSHRFSHIRSVEDFRRQLPISKYEDYAPYIERVRAGELTSMFGEQTKLLMFAMTSGTTGRAKYIPVTDQFFREYRQGWQIWGLQAYRDHMDLLSKKALQLSSSWDQSRTQTGIPCGNISGLAAETRPRIASGLFLLPRELLQIDDTEAKLYASLRIAASNPRVGMAMTANPSTLIEFGRRLDRYREQLVRDLFDGTLAKDFAIPPHVRSRLERWTANRQPQRARELEHQILASGRLFARDVWRHLSLLAVWTGGSVGVYLPRLKEHFGDLPVRDHGLSASEGRMTIPLEDGCSAGILDYQHHFFEFIPIAEYGSSQPTVLEAHELEEGRDYYILLTTSNGFYRYDIGDVVRCQRMAGQAPVLEFLHKGAHFSNVTGEKLSETQVISAVKGSMSEMLLPISEFTLAPKLDADYPVYELLIEADLPQQRLRQLAQLAEQRLVQLNYEYADKRSSGRIKPVRVRPLPAGTWEKYRLDQLSRRGSLEQYKHPFLVNDLQFGDRIAGRRFVAISDGGNP